MNLRILFCFITLLAVGVIMRLGLGVAPDFKLVAAGTAIFALSVLLGRVISAPKNSASPRTKTAELIFGILCLLAVFAIFAGMFVFGKRFRGGLYVMDGMNPTEIVKPILVVATALLLPRARGGWIIFASLAALDLLIVLMRDLGLLVVLNAGVFIMLNAERKLRFWHYALTIPLVLAMLWAARFVPHVATRFDVWLNPFSDPTGRGWQTLQGLSAMAAGGWWGRWFTDEGIQAVPIVTSDFVWAAVAEEMGLVMCGVLLVVYGILFCEGFRGTTLLGIGATGMLAVQTILNLGGVTKLIPMTGIVLPFISQGGSGLVAMCCLAGLAAARPQISRKNN